MAPRADRSVTSQRYQCRLKESKRILAVGIESAMIPLQIHGEILWNEIKRRETKRKGDGHAMLARVHCQRQVTRNGASPGIFCDARRNRTRQGVLLLCPDLRVCIRRAPCRCGGRGVRLPTLVRRARSSSACTNRPSSR
jgi:hypothetical protein